MLRNSSFLIECLPIKYSPQKTLIIYLNIPIEFNDSTVIIEHNKFLSILNLIYTIEAYCIERLHLLQVATLGIGDVCDGTQHDVDVAGWNPV